jgi:hypothetical protein
MLVALTGTRWTKRRAVANMAERPEIFGRLLAVNCGVKRLGAVSWRDWRALVAGF